MQKVLLVQGPNMRYLGKRLPELYGHQTAADVDAICRAHSKSHGYDLEILHSSSEGPVIDRIYDLLDENSLNGLVMNPAALIHNGHGLRACVQAIPVPYIEVHMTNIDARGLKSLLAPHSVGVIAGFGVQSYVMALTEMSRLLQEKSDASVPLSLVTGAPTSSSSARN